MLVLRQTKGSPLTIAEEDGNFVYLQGLFESINSGAFVKTDGSTPIFNTLGYNSLVSIVNPTDIVHKQYVDTAIATIDLSGYLPKSAGSGQALTGDLYLGANNLRNVAALYGTNGNLAFRTSGSNRFISAADGSTIIDASSKANGVGINTGLSYAYLLAASTTNEQFTIPNKGGVGGTFAMLSDLTEGTVTSVSGTTNRITSTGGATPVIDIASTYVGQTSITTLGTIGAGTWQGSQIVDAYIASAATWNAKFTLPALTNGSVLFSNGTTISQDNANFFYDAPNHRLGLGTILPLGMLHLVDSSSSAIRGLIMDNLSVGTSSAKFYTRKSRNSGVITTGDVLGNWSGAGHDGTNYVDAADIRILSTGTIATGIIPGQIIIRTANASGVLTAALTIGSDQSAVFGGNVSGSNLSGTNTGDQTSVTGNAGTATALQTARNINGVSFNGTANITIQAQPLSSIALGSIIAYNTANTPTAITSTTGLMALQNNAGVISWVAATGTGNNVFAISPSISGATLTATNDIGFASGKGLMDSNGKYIIGTPATVASAVNYIQVTNSSTGNGVSIAAAGTDTNISLALASKGGGNINLTVNGLIPVLISTSGLQIINGFDFIIGNTTGSKIGQSTSRLSFYGITPVSQPTNATGVASRVASGATAVTITDTYDGYTIAQFIRAVRTTGLVA